MAFNFAPLLRPACGGAARRLRALRALSFLSFSHCNFTEKMPFFYNSSTGSVRLIRCRRDPPDDTQLEKNNLGSHIH